MRRGLFVLILTVLCGAPIWAEDKPDPANIQGFDIMEIMLFLNANHLPPGAVSHKIDRERKRVEYFDKENRLMREYYLDANKDLISKEYDAAGRLLREDKITRQTVLDGTYQARLSGSTPKP